MIITYANGSESESYNRMVFIPDTMPWKLAVEVENVIEDSEEDPDGFQTDYALKLVAGTCTKKVIMNCEDLRASF